VCSLEKKTLMRARAFAQEILVARYHEHSHVSIVTSSVLY
jgi:hypothetical protein